MLTASRLLSRHARRTVHTSAIAVVAVFAAIVLLAALLAVIVTGADLLLPESEPLLAAPMRW